MARYRITFMDSKGLQIGSGDFDAKDDNEAPRGVRARLPARAVGYEIWRDDASQRRELVFAEWSLFQHADAT